MSMTRFTRWSLLTVALGLALTSTNVQVRTQSLGVVQQVRVDIGHGDLDAARRVAYGTTGTPGDRALAQALIDMFEGKAEDARAKLTPLANAAPVGEAALELGLLDVREGHVDEGRRRLDPIAAVRTFRSADDYFRLARAARGIREFLLANDAYQRIDDAPRADIQTSWGEMFFERHQPGDAMQSYRKALDFDDRWIPAYLGIARALADEDPESSLAALEQARKIAPDYPDTWLVTAELQLDREDTDAAGQALDALARVKPGTVEEAALRAAIAYKKDGIPGVEAAVGRVQAINPRSSLGYRVAGEQAAREYRFDDAAVLARKATEIDRADPLAHFDLGLYLMRTGDEPAARTALETSFELDRSGRVTKNLLDLLDTIDKFVVIPHNNFIFKFAPEEAEVLKTYALPLADEAYKQFVERYGITPKGPILIEVFPRHDDFAVRTLGLPGLVGALGACFGRVISMDSPRARQPLDFSWQATLWHELAHVFTLQASEYRVPRWLTEGVSQYEEHRRAAAWGRELTLEYAQAFGAGKHFGVKKLPQAFKKPETLSMAYFEASLVVEHLVAQAGEAGLRTLLTAYANRATDEEAFAKAFGRSVDDVDKSFNAFITSRYADLSRAMAEPPTKNVDPADVAALKTRAELAPGNFISQLTYGAALVRNEQFVSAKAPLERAAELAPQATGDMSPRALLALIAEHEGDKTRARKELRALLEYDHTNVAAARQLAKLAAEANVEDEENFALRLVADLDPFDASIHSRLGKRLLAKGESAAAILEFQAALALGPTNPADAHTDLGEALLKSGRTAEARAAAMAALAQAPTYARAQDLLLATQSAGR
jgi:tetratricopeptide (TPR) repeat protein